MRVAVDARTATGAFTGIGRYTSCLVAAFARGEPDLDLTVLVTRRALPGFAQLARPGVSLAPTALEIPYHPLSDLWLHVRLPLLLASRGIRVLFSCANYLPALSGGARRVVTIHDMVCYRFPELDPWSFVAYLRGMLALAARVADRIVAVSHATAGEVARILRVPEERIEVIPNGVLPLFRKLPGDEIDRRRAAAAGIATAARAAGAPPPPSIGPDQPFLLAVGARIPRKNFGRLVEALAVLAARGLPHHLVIAGPPGPSQPELGALVDRHGLAGRVHFAGYPGDDDLVTLYNRASLFVYPSLYEGFGIPVLEAMACGTPVACSGEGALAEVAGDAALRFDPRSVAGIASACERALSDAALRARLVAAGLARAGEFTWEATARRTAALLRSVAA
jgi:glycosyltransferase involved in cell wall biosynthesis